MSVTQPLLAERYRLVRSLGQGGMGRVWLARDEVLHRDVAIKEVVPPSGLTPQERDEMRTRTLREARAAARLNHPSVVRVYDIVRTDVHPWIVMEYVESRSLHQVINEDGALPPNRVAHIGLQVLGALRAAHRAGVLHRDVKPSNVLLTDDGRVVLTDFGLATMAGEATVTRPGMVLGSPAYIAPERARHGHAGPESDLWSLGATLYAAVEGSSPFQRSSAIETLTALVTEEAPQASRAGALRPVLNGLLRKDPASRIDAEKAERMLRRAAGGGLAARMWLVPKPRPAAAQGDPAPPLPQAPAPISPPAPAPATPPAPASPAAPEPARKPDAAPVAATATESATAKSAESDAAESSAAPAARPVEATMVIPPSKTSAEKTGDQSPPAARPARFSAGRAAAGTGGAAAGAAGAAAGAGTVARPEPGGPLPSRAGERGVLGRTVRRPWVLVAAAAVVVLLIVALVALAGGGTDRTTKRTPAAPSPKPSAASGTAAQPAPPTSGQDGQPAAPGTGQTGGPAGTPGPTGPVIPAGWHMHTDPTGFSVAIPDGWALSHEGTMIYFREPGTGRALGIDQTDRPADDPVADWTSQEQERANNPRWYPAYQRIRIESVPYFVKCADWEFTYDQSGTRTHVINRGFVTSDHQAYAIWWATPESNWQESLPYFKTITETFKPKP